MTPPLASAGDCLTRVRGILASPLSDERAWKAICRLTQEHPAGSLRPAVREEKPRSREAAEVQAPVAEPPRQRVYVLGGSDKAHRKLAHVEVLDTAAGKWDPLQLSMVESRSRLGAAAVGSRIYVVGGAQSAPSRGMSVDAYDTRSREWASLPPLATDFVEDFAVAVLDGKLYVIGGRHANDVSQATNVFDTVGHAWDSACTMATPRCGLAASVLDGRLYAIGGSTPGARDLEDLDSVELYNPGTDTWSPMPDMRMCRTWLASAATADECFAIGGLCDGRPLSSIEVFDRRTQNWDTLPDMRYNRSHLAAAVASGKLYVVGGNNAGGFGQGEEILNEVEAFDLVQREWQASAPLCKNRYGSAAVVLES